MEKTKGTISVIYKKIKQIITEKRFKYIYFFIVILSVQFILGHNLQTLGYTAKDGMDIVVNILKIIFLSVILTTIFYFGEYIIKKSKNYIQSVRENKKLENNNKIQDNKGTKKKFKTTVIMYFFIIILCWMPAFLAFCPAILNYDGPSQIIAYTVGEGTMTTQQPLISTIMMTAFFQMGIKVLGSSTLGMMCFSLFQMCFMAGVFAYTTKFIEEKTENKFITIATLVFYAIFPFNQLFPLMTTKDVMFAGLTLIFVIGLYKFPEKEFKIKEYILLSIFAVLMLLFRNNAVYALVVGTPIMMFFLINNKKKLIDIVSVFFVIIIMYQLCYQLLIIVTNSVEQSDKEKLSVITQAVARVSKQKKEELTEEEIKSINYYFDDIDNLIEIYDTNISDDTKMSIVIDRYEENPQGFYKLFIDLAKKYPIICMDSFLDTIRGYWYIFDDSFNQIFHDMDPKSKGCLELTFYVVTDGTEENMVRDLNKWPALRDFYKSMFCENNYTKIPVLYVIFQPAIYFYIVLACLLYAIYKKDVKLILPTIYLILYFLTCFLGPGAIVRYIYANIVTTPFILALCKKKNKEEAI